VDAPLSSLAERLHSAAIHLLRRLRREDEAMGLGPARASALSVLVFAGPLSLGELARAEQVRPPTMSRIVKALEGAGLVRRERAAADARAIRLAATARGRKLLLAGRRRRVRALVELLGSLSAREQVILRQSVELLERALAGRPAGDRR
jgi:DNA-binding MarR family transcriptional regulator